MGQYDSVPTLISRWGAASVLLYDIVLTANDEITYIWSSKWTFPKLLYIWLRYFGLAAAIFACAISVQEQSFNFCADYDIFNSTWLLVLAGMGDALLVLRVLALLRDKQRVCLALKITYGFVYTIEVALLIYYLSHPPNQTAGSTAYANNLGCVVTTPSNGLTKASVADLILAIATAPVLVLNAILLGLVLYNILPAYRRQSASGVTTSIITAVLRDGAMYFVVVTAASVAVTFTPVVWFDKPPQTNVALPWFMCIVPLSSSRLFLNLRATAARAKELMVQEQEELEGLRRGVRARSAGSQHTTETDRTQTGRTERGERTELASWEYRTWQDVDDEV